eukprot:763601-Hanusia_phi.AAC.7
MNGYGEPLLFSGRGRGYTSQHGRCVRRRPWWRKGGEEEEKLGNAHGDEGAWCFWMRGNVADQVFNPEQAEQAVVVGQLTGYYYYGGVDFPGSCRYTSVPLRIRRNRHGQKLVSARRIQKGRSFQSSSGGPKVQQRELGPPAEIAKAGQGPSCRI